MVMEIQPTSPAKAPSHVFFGLMLIRGVLPNALPPRKANVSEAIIPQKEINIATSPTVQCAWPPRIVGQLLPIPISN
jgi:hypothetical protein